jgi:hypothetical protein
MKLIIFLLMFSAFAEENTEGLFGKKKADFLEEMIEKDNPGKEDIACVEQATNRNELNRCKNVMKETKREEKKNPEKEESKSED